MKNLFLALSIISLTTIAFTSCDESDSKDHPLEEVDHSEITYQGDVTVLFKGEEVVTNNVECSYHLINDAFLELAIKDIKFVPQMPVTITPVITNIPYTKVVDNNGNFIIRFSADSIVPTIGNNPYEAYTAKNIEGQIENNSIQFSLNFGAYPTSYHGTK